MGQRSGSSRDHCGSQFARLWSLFFLAPGGTALPFLRNHAKLASVRLARRSLASLVRSLAARSLPSPASIHAASSR